MGRKKKADPSFEWFVRRYDDYRSHHVRYSSNQMMATIVRKHMDEFHEKRLSEAFTLTRIRTWYRLVTKNRKLSIEYRNRMISNVQRMLLQAMRWKYIRPSLYADFASILEPMQKPSTKKEKKRIYDKEQIRRFLQAIDNDEDRLMFRLFCFLGARIGEFLGLTWDCYDANTGVVEIKQQLTYEGRQQWVLSKVLKTNESYRFCPLSKALMDELNEYREGVPHEAKAFLFSLNCTHKTPFGETTFRHRLNAYVKKAGLPPITPHGFRHSKATLMLEVCTNMEEVKAAARFLGHSATMLIDTYGHAKEDAMLMVLARLED